MCVWYGMNEVLLSCEEIIDFGTDYLDSKNLLTGTLREEKMEDIECSGFIILTRNKREQCKCVWNERISATVIGEHTEAHVCVLAKRNRCDVMKALVLQR